MKEERYNSIDGLRTIGAIGIVAMHIKEITNISINGYFYNNIIPFFNYAVFLFMIISGFGMCCGYYEKIKNNEISLDEFYKKRYKKVLPFFAILVVIDILVERTIPSIFEAFANLTLSFAFLPNPQMSVIGVGWTLGVIFAFYMLFPFFVFIINDKKRAWKSFVISLIFSYLCKNYFFTDKFVLSNFDFRINIVYCFVFFIMGGLIYLYRNNIVKIIAKRRKLILLLTIIITISYFIFCDILQIKELLTLELCLVFGSWVIYAIVSNGKILSNKFTKFISNISFEIYLCHLFIYRVIEKIGLVSILQNKANPLLSYIYIYIYIYTLGGAIIFSIITKKIIKKMEIKKDQLSNKFFKL